MVHAFQIKFHFGIIASPCYERDTKPIWAERNSSTFDTIHGAFIAEDVRCVSRDDIIDRALIAIMFSLKVCEVALLEKLSLSL